MLVLIFSLLLLNFYLLKKIGKSFDDKSFYFLLVAGVFMWNLLPILLNIFFWKSEFTFKIVSYDEFKTAAFIELAYLTINLLIVNHFAAKKHIFLFTNRLNLFNRNSQIFFLKALKFSIIIVTLYDLITILFFKIGYYEHISTQSTIITIFLPLVITCKAMLYIYLIYQRSNTKISLIVTIVILFDLAIVVMSGSRMVLIILLILPLLIYLNIGKKMSLLKKSGFITVIILFCILLIKIIPAIENIRSSNRTIKVADISNELSLEKSNSLITLFLQSLSIKLNSVQNAALLIKNEGYNNNNNFIQMVFEPFKILIPRAIWPNKHNLFNKTSGKVAAKYMGMDEETGVVGISPAQGILWSNGIIGIAVSLIFSFFFIKTIIALVQMDNLIAKSFVLVLINFPIFDRIPSTYPTIINIFILQIIVYIMLTVILNLKIKSNVQ